MTHWWILVLLPSLGGVAGYVFSNTQEPVYEAYATILVEYRGPGLALSGASDFTRSAQLASTYARLATARPFLNRVRQTPTFVANPGSLGSVSAFRDYDPPVLEIRSRHSDPESAAVTAQVVAEEFIDYVIEQRLGEIARLQSVAASQGITNISDLSAAQFTALDSLSLLDPEVAPPGSPVIPRTRENVLLGAIAGLVLGAAIAILLETLRDTVRFADQLPRRFGVPSLGVVFRWSQQDFEGTGLVISESPTSSYAESLRQIRANIQFTLQNQPGRVMLVSSPSPGEGKSTIICNLAVAFASAGKRVITVDGDLRRPSVHRLMTDVPREPGLSNFLAAMEPEVSSIIHPSGHEGVSVIPSGPTPPNSAELLGSPRMSSLLDRLRHEFDMVLIDSPPMLMVADGSILASQVDGTVLIADGFGTRSAALKAALGTLQNAQANVMGVVINKLKRPRFGYGYSYPSYYSYQSYYSYYGSTDDTAMNGTGRIIGSLTSGPKRVLSLFRRK